MAIGRRYFEYEIRLRCGIPSVTLEGTKSDWESILTRLDKLSQFGEQTTAWAELLKPILKRFISAFDGKPDTDFWSKVAHFHSGGSGPTYLSGWITAFCLFGVGGEWHGPSIENMYVKPDEQKPQQSRSGPTLTLDGIRYAAVNSAKVPAAYCEVDVILDDNGQMFDCVMVSGHVGLAVCGENGDTLRPAPAWFMYIKGGAEGTE